MGLFETFEPLVPPIARSVRRSCPASIDAEDLEQIGRLALAQACERYDESREATFPTYVRMRIRGAMIDAIRGPEFREASWERDAVRIDAMQVAFTANAVELPAGDPFVSHALDRAIAVLPARQGRLLATRYPEGLSQREAAEREGCSKTTAAREERSALATMRALLRSNMNNDVVTDVPAARKPRPDWHICLALPKRIYTVKGTVMECGEDHTTFREFSSLAAAAKAKRDIEKKFKPGADPLEIATSKILGFDYRRIESEDFVGALLDAVGRCAALQQVDGVAGIETYYAVIDPRTTKVRFVTPKTNRNRGKSKKLCRPPRTNGQRKRCA